MGDLKIRWNPSIIALVLFVFAATSYMGINRLPLTHPGNIKAADPFYHTTLTEAIIETKQWNYFDAMYSTGVEKTSNSQPPLFYIDTAMLSMLSGIPVWATMFFLISICQAFFVIIVYLITKEVFDNEDIALIAAALSVFPIPLNVWLYGLYIGLWIQVPSYLFIMTFFWLFIKYMKTRETRVLFYMSLCMSSILLVHSPDLLLIFLPFLVAEATIIKESLDKKNLKNFIFKNIAFGLIPIIFVLVLLPKFLFVWKDFGESWYKPGFYGFSRDMFNNPAERLVFPNFSFLPMWVVGLSLIGVFLLILNLLKPFTIPKVKFKNKKPSLVFSLEKNRWSGKTLWLFLVGHSFFLFYLSKAFFSSPYYFGRARALQPFLLFPVAAYMIYLMIEFMIYVFVKNEKYLLVFEKTLIALIVVIIVVATYPGYKSLSESLSPASSGEHLPIDEWQAYLWMHNNIPEEKNVLFFGTVFQAESMYSRRIHAVVDMNDYTRAVNDYINTNQTPLVYKGGWGGNTVRSRLKQEVSLFDYKFIPEPNNTFNVLDFDYVFFQNLNMAFPGTQVTIAQVNQVFMNDFVTKYGFVPVYNQRGYVILKNEKRP